MQTLSATLTANQKVGGRALAKLVLTKDATTKTYGVDTDDRIINATVTMTPFSQKARVTVWNASSTLTALDLRYYKGVISFGYNDATQGDEYQALPPFWVLAQNLESSMNGLQCTFELIGTPDLLDQDRANSEFYPDLTDAQTVKDLLRQIASGAWDVWTASTIYTTDTWAIPTSTNGYVYEVTTGGTSSGGEPAWTTEEGDAISDGTVTWTCRGREILSFNHTSAYTITFDSEDSLIDSFLPRDSFRILINDSRLTIIKQLLEFTGCAFRVEADGELHIFVPTTSGNSYNYEYQLAVSGEHTFFDKTHRERFMSPNYIVVSSHPDHDTQYTGNAEDTDSSDLKEIREHHYMRLVSNDQAGSMAAAILAQHQWDAEKASGKVPINVGTDVWDYINFTDARDNGDTRAGNIGYVQMVYAPAKFDMMLKFGSQPFGILPALAIPRPIESDQTRVGIEAVWDTLRETWGFLERLVDRVTEMEKRRQEIWGWELPISSQQFVVNVTLSSTGQTNITWSAGTIDLFDGRQSTFDSGSAVLTSTHYLYHQWGNSTLQESTTYTDARGSDKVLIAVAKRGSTASQKAFYLSPYTDNILINTDSVMDGLVTALQLADGAVEEAKLATGAVTEAKIGNAEVNAAKIAANAVEEAKINGSAVTEAKIAANAVTATKINVAGLNGSTGRIIVADQTDADMVTGGVNSHAVTLINAGKVLISGSTTLDNWSHASDATLIDGGDIYTGTVTASQILAGTITATEMATDSITTDKIFANSVTTVKLNDASVTTDKMSNLSEVFGDGSDGNVTISANTTLTADMYYDNLTVNSTYTLTTAGYRVFVKNTLDNNGTIRWNGNNGEAGAGGGGRPAGGSALSSANLGGSGAGGSGGDVDEAEGGGGGSGGGVVVIAAKIIDNTGGVISANGGNGGNGWADDAADADNSDAGAAGGSVNPSLGGAAGAGGQGGGIGGGAAGGVTAAQSGTRSYPFCVLMWEVTSTTSRILGGAGGGGGTAQEDQAGSETGGGGGGGGGGGTVVLIYTALTVGTETATGGTGGTGATTGSGSATNGSAGSAGTVIKVGFV